jgi:hypothetical protein
MEYKEAIGDCRVSFTFSQNPQLGWWVSTQQKANRDQKLTKERLEKLNSIGFDWGEQQCDWDERFRQLMEYKEAIGDCRVPRTFSQNPQLGHWVQNQRQANKDQKLTKERLENLKSIGFDWGKQQCDWITSKKQKIWDVHFRELLSYFQTHGDFNVTQRHPRNPLLASWATEQRNEYDLKRRGEQTSMTPLREAKLDAIGFTCMVGGTEEEAPPMECVASATVRPEEVRSGTQVQSENNGVAVPNSIPSG